MKADAIRKLVSTRLKKVKAQFEKLQVSFDPEVLHDFRLEMKKLKAFIRLLNTTLPHHQRISLCKRLTTFYSLTGNLRNLQLHEQRIASLIKTHNLKRPEVYMTWLEQEQLKVLHQLPTAAQKIDFSKLSKEVLLQAPAHLSAQDCQSYLGQQLQALTGILVPVTNSDEALHEVRKIIKDIGYNRNYIGTYMSLLLPVGLVKKEGVDALAEKLGVFHDLCLSLTLLQAPAASQISEPEERGVLQDLIPIIEADKKKMKQEVLQALLSL